MADTPYATVAVAELIVIRANVGLGEQDRVIQFEGHIDRDAPQSEMDALCDKIMAAGDRLKAKHLLPTYRRQMENDEYVLNDNRRRLAELEAGLKAMDEAREAKIVELQAGVAEAVSRARDEHLASGRRSEFKPPQTVGRDQKAKIAELLANQQKEHAEAVQQRSVLENEIKEGTRKIEKWQALIAEQVTLARDEPL